MDVEEKVKTLLLMLQISMGVIVLSERALTALLQVQIFYLSLAPKHFLSFLYKVMSFFKAHLPFLYVSLAFPSKYLVETIDSKYHLACSMYD